MDQRDIERIGDRIIDEASRSIRAITQRDETNKPPIPAHDYADRWARDTLSGKENGQFEWGERNLARSYLALATQLAAAQSENAALRTEAAGLGGRVAACEALLDEAKADEVALRDVVRTMDEALADALGGWRYIRANHGDLYGVGWDRVHLKIDAARSAAAGVGEKSA